MNMLEAQNTLVSILNPTVLTCRSLYKETRNGVRGKCEPDEKVQTRQRRRMETK